MKTDNQILKDFIARMSNGEKAFIHQVVIGHKALVMTGPELQVAFEKAVEKSTAFTLYKNNVKIDELRVAISKDQKHLKIALAVIAGAWVLTMVGIALLILN